MNIAIPTRPADGDVVSVMPGLWWLRVPIPFKLDHVNVWLLEDGDGWTAIDTGISSPRSKAIWRDVMSRHFGGKPLKRLLVTHCHPDHVGLAGSLCTDTGAELLMSRTEWLWTCWEQQISEAESRRLFADYIARVGLDEGVTWDEVYKGGTMAELTDVVPRRYHRVQNGDRLDIGGRTWQVMTGGGHSLEHVCLYCADASVLISADHVLPRISPNIGVSQVEPESNPLGDFFDTLGTLAALPADTLVLPSHNEPFEGLRQRIAEMVDHHTQRLALVKDICHAPKTIAEASRELFPRQMFGYDIRLAANETWAHLNYLVGDGQILRWTDDAGTYRFQRA
ncbi:MBL fold metallo-hydrolase [Rhodoligotrophos defluvii]|uniref:MBL fold metallo-hydrolase n=1 Tax=Rhodoligotrophos defluvii TaxID=2561934 RepID=UPI0010C97655|nr:MBL fold metallo-hydrolase [Rhodoligotrophos defluvii]